jgi:glycyl-tRNA synthetase
MQETVDLQTITSLAKRRGFVYPTSEIYGGLGSSYDYGPLGTELLRNIRDAWWKQFIHRRPDVVGLDSQIILHPDTWSPGALQCSPTRRWKMGDAPRHRADH